MENGCVLRRFPVRQRFPVKPGMTRRMRGNDDLDAGKDEEKAGEGGGYRPQSEAEKVFFGAFGTLGK